MDLVQLERAVREMHHDGEMTADTFHQNMLIVAFEYAVRDVPEQAKRLVGCVPDGYIEQVLPIQMEQGENFYKLVYGLAKYLDARDEVEDSDVEVEKVLLQRPASGQVN